MDPLVPEIEEERGYTQKTQVTNKKELTMTEGNDGNHIPSSQDFRKIIREELQALEGKFVTWKWMLGIFIAFAIPFSLWLNSRFDGVNERVDSLGDELSSNYIYYNAHKAESVVKRFASGKILTPTGEKILASEPELVESIHKLYAENLRILPASVPRLIFSKMEKEGQDPMEIAQRNQIDIYELSAIIMAEAYQVKNEIHDKVTLLGDILVL